VLAASLAIGLVSLIGACSGAMPYGGAPPTVAPTPGELAAQLAQCRKGIEEWKKSAGQVDYPKTMTLTFGQATAYNAAIDISDTPQPAASRIIVARGEPTAEAITVKCAVAARLRSIGHDMTVEPAEDEWQTREFGPSGVVKWTWTVTASSSSNKTLVLEMQPAHLENGEPLVSSSGTEIVEVSTQVQVKSTWIDRSKEWFETQWPKLALIVGLVAGGIAGAVRWLGLPWPPRKWFPKKRTPRRSRRSPAPATASDPPDKTPVGTG
jgi:hypothetical protein